MLWQENDRQKNDGGSEESGRKQKRPRRSGTGVKFFCEEKLRVAGCSGFLGSFCCLRRGRSLTAPLRLRRGRWRFPNQFRGHNTGHEKLGPVIVEIYRGL